MLQFHLHQLELSSFYSSAIYEVNKFSLFLQFSVYCQGRTWNMITNSMECQPVFVIFYLVNDVNHTYIHTFQISCIFMHFILVLSKIELDPVEGGGGGSEVSITAKVICIRGYFPFVCNSKGGFVQGGRA